ncbi:MAG TPA: ABC transporter substrate-binding protein [Stellaceae bacterium]|nr:ABC transporter substrate-binding protein [Stellaceae bacterium]
MMKPALLAFALLLLASAAHAASGKLVLYTSQPDKIAAETVAAFTRKEPGVSLEIFRSGTTEVMNRLQAELLAGDPRPDVLFIADALTMEELKADHRLMAYPGADVVAFPADAYDKDFTYFGSKLITTGIIYNTAASRKPGSWKDLLLPQAKGQVILPSPLYSGAALIHMAAMSGDADVGKYYYAALAANGAVPARGNGAVTSAVAGGEKMYGIVVEFMALNAKAKGSPVDFVFPAEGVTAVTEPVAILKTAKNPAAAKAFVDFILSKEGQELAVRQGFFPARRDVAPPPGFPSGASLKIIPLDLHRAAAESDALKKRFAALFGG